VSKGNRTTLRIHMRGIIGQIQLPQNRQRLRGEGLIKLNHIEIRHCHPETRHELLRR
jgi:hypothetical protein